MEESKNIKKKAFSGFFWKSSERVLARLVSLIVSIILARLLTPDNYSVVGIVGIFFAFANLFISGGFNQALIQKKDIENIDYTTAFCINILFASFFYILIFFTSPLIAKIYDKEILTPVFRIMGLTFFINAFKSILCSYTSKNLKFKSFFRATIIGTIISAFIGITIAYLGYGPWALVAQQMSNALIDTVFLSIGAKIKFSLKFSKQSFKFIFNYGWKMMVASFITTIYDEIRPLVIGLKFTPSDLSFYTKGKSFPGIINSTFNDSLASVLFPVMSKLQDDKVAILNCSRRFFQVSSFFIFPIMLGFAVVGDKFISIFLTNKWMPAFPYILIFCFTYMLNVIQTGNLQVIKALGRTDLVLKLEIIKKSTYIIITVLFIIFSKSPVILAVTSCINAIFAIFINSAPNKKLVNYSFASQLKDLFPNFINTLIMAVAVYFIGKINLNIYLLFFLQIFSGVIIYILINYITKNKTFSYVLSTVKDFIKRGDK